MDDTSTLPYSNSAALLDAASHVRLLASKVASLETISRSTSPSIPSSKRPGEDEKKRYRPRTFSYFAHLPFPVEDQAARDAALAGILKQLFIAIKAEDFSPGALHWTRELQAWLNLKFEMTRELRATLARLYYHMSLAPGLDTTTSDRFARMLVSLTRYCGLPITLCAGKPPHVAGYISPYLPLPLLSEFAHSSDLESDI